MRDREELLADLAATVDYLTEIGEESDALSFELAADLVSALDRVKLAADTAGELVRSEMLRQLEAGGPKVVGRRVFSRRKVTADRYDHDRIAAAAVDYALRVGLDTETGEFQPIRRVVELGVRKMRDLYLSPSSSAKVTILPTVGLEARDVRTREFKHWALVVADEQGEDDERD